MNKPAAKDTVIIKKYANRRLYDTETSAYITLEDLCDRVKADRNFTVVDAKTGHDLTRQVLTQIIFEQETKGFQILPTNVLRSVIRFYDDKMRNVLQHYLEASMTTFLNNQERMQGMMSKAGDGLTPLEELTRQNVALFEKTMQIFNPFGSMFTGKEEAEETQKKRAKR